MEKEFEKDFEAWLYKHYECELEIVVSSYNEEWDEYVDLTEVENFRQLSFSMQFGVYQEFFDSVGIYIRVMNHDGFEITNAWDFFEHEFQAADTWEEKQRECINKCSEIYLSNKRLNEEREQSIK